MATAPVWALLTFFYIRDRYEKEPRSLLLRLFFMGMLVTLVAAPLGLLGIKLFEPFVAGAGWWGLWLENLIPIALVEEYVKFLVVWRLAYSHPAFDEPYDGMLYAITASLGFAALENVLYVAQGGAQVALVRAFLSVPAHALFAATMGYYISRAKFAARANEARAYLRWALIIPTLLHGIFDFLLSTGHDFLAMGVVPLSVLMWVLTLRQIRLSELRSPFRPDWPDS